MTQTITQIDREEETDKNVKKCIRSRGKAHDKPDTQENFTNNVPNFIRDSQYATANTLNLTPNSSDLINFDSNKDIKPSTNEEEIDTNLSKKIADKVLDDIKLLSNTKD